MTLKINFKEYCVNPRLIITFIPNVSTGCSNSSILKCKCPFKWHSSRKCFFEIVRHAGGILSKAFVSIFEDWRQCVKGKWKGSSLGYPKRGLLYSSKIRWEECWKLFSETAHVWPKKVSQINLAVTELLYDNLR